MSSVSEAEQNQGIEETELARVLVVAGADPSGCAGLSADTRALLALGIHPLPVVTAVTVQDTHRMFQSSPVDPFLVEKQLSVVLEDVGANCIKIGMLALSATVELVTRVLETKARGIPVVLDPVLFSSSGTSLLEPAGQTALVERLMPLCALVTPNVQEAEALTGISVDSEADMHSAADRFLLMGQDAVLIKGGHLPGDSVVDLLRTADGMERRFESPRVPKSVRGTGCTLASAIAAGIAEGLTLESAVARAHRVVSVGIDNAPHLGKQRAHCFKPGGNWC